MIEEKKGLIYLLPVVMLFGLGALSMNITIYDELWYHLLTGRYIHINQAIPQTGFMVFGHTETPMLYHSWLAQLLFYLVFLAGGMPFLKGLHFLLGASLGLVLYLVFRRRAGIQAFFILLPLTAFVARDALSLRPNGLSVILFCMILLLLDRFRETHKRINIVTVTLLLILWINLHGFWVYGALLMFLFAVEGLFRRDRLMFFSIIACLLAVAAAVFIKYGGLEILFILPRNSIRVMENRYHEWYSVFYFLRMLITGEANLPLIAYLKNLPLIMMTVVISLILFLKKQPLIDYLVGITFTLLALISYRNFMFMIPVLLYVAGSVADELFIKMRVRRYNLLALTLVLQVFLMVFFVNVYQPFRTDPLPLEKLTARLPFTENLIITHPDMADYVLFLLNKSAWNEYNYVLADTRAELYAPGEMKNVFDLLKGKTENLTDKKLEGLNPVFILHQRDRLLGQLLQRPDYNIIAEENGYYLIMSGDLSYISGNDIKSNL